MSESAEEAFFRWLVAIRRHIHRFPEPAFQEEKTAAFIEKKLAELGLRARRVAGTGVLCEIGEGPPWVALRADMDALPLQEETGLPFASRVPGVMHACGHDGHVAMLLGAARLLARDPPARGGVRLLFQPAEESGGGARALIEAGVLEGVVAIFGGHIDRHFEVGEIAVNEGLICAYTDRFVIRLKGRGGHAAWPHEAVDAVVAGSFLVTAIQALVAREVNPAYPAVVTVGRFEAGTAFNVIAEEARLEGTIRSTEARIRERIHQGLARLVRGVEELYRVAGELEIFEGYPPVINTPRETELAREAARRVVGEKGLVRMPHPSLGGEDFSFYLKHVPGCFVRFGARKKGWEDVPAHSPRFDFDERVLPIGARFYFEVAHLALREEAHAPLCQE
ncbi:M20 family metallopeptidase [Thermosulfurimonas sp. F29]|uniref:M20 metallopeptidase family protein n=1 Tax=Thermosulfurimonas sp. F29 TaxID=2867247 RepID=UPI001C82F518|nr:M20 family metallopeptidase [Thermosulfurimonas sp. F29]MBX6423652.1 amidohydrolase [Thermosulfurimonas sp. F29]